MNTFTALRNRITPQSATVAALWTVARVWVGWTFFTAGLSKIGSPVWTGQHAGVALRGFLGFSASPAMTGGPHPQVMAPYAWMATHVFMPHDTFLSYLVAGSETLVGLALILGLCTRFAALGGALLNINYLLAGSAGVNTPMLIIELSIVLVGVSAGSIGLDAFILPVARGRIVRIREHGGFRRPTGILRPVAQ
jgi:thiosulfate dehydrogenase (quinone) large subunit